jgi:hypothetical protein
MALWSEHQDRDRVRDMNREPESKAEAEPESKAEAETSLRGKRERLGEPEQREREQ